MVGRFVWGQAVSMNQRATLVIAAVITGFVLVTLGAVIGAPSEPEAPAAAVSPSISAAELEQRELQWRQVEENYVTADYPEADPPQERRRRHDDDEDDDDDDDDDHDDD